MNYARDELRAWLDDAEFEEKWDQIRGDMFKMRWIVHAIFWAFFLATCALTVIPLTLDLINPAMDPILRCSRIMASSTVVFFLYTAGKRSVVPFTQFMIVHHVVKGVKKIVNRE